MFQRPQRQRNFFLMVENRHFNNSTLRKIRSSIAGLSVGALRVRRFVFFVGANDALDEVVANDVFFAELGAADAFDFAANFERFDEAAAFAGRQIDLRGVAGDDGFGVETEARQKHFHLFAGGVLRFVENDEGVVERAAAHEGERRDFDDSLFDEGFEFVGVEHFVKRVVKRTHVWIDFFLERAGKEAELFAGFNGGPRENDAVHLFGEERADGHGDGEIGFARAARADAEDHVVRFDLVHVMFLRGVFRHDLFFAERARLAVLENFAGSALRFVERDAHEAFDLFAGKMTAVARGVIVFFDDFYGAVDGVVRAFDGELRVLQMSAHAERIFEQAHVFVEGAKEGFDFSGDGDAAFHQAGRWSRCGVRSNVRVVLTSDRLAVTHRIVVPPERQLRQRCPLQKAGATTATSRKKLY